MAPSRLWSKLGLTQPLMSVWNDDAEPFFLGDHDLQSITINRGSDGSVFGEQEHTLEVTTTFLQKVRTDEPIACAITDYGAQQIVNRIGGTVASIKNRFFGRIGRQVITDHGGIGDAAKGSTTVYASKWQSQLRNSERVGNQIDGEQVMYLFQHFMRPEGSNLPHLPDPLFTAPSSHYGHLSNDLDLGAAKITYAEFATKYLEAPGYYVQNTRAGHDRVFTIERMWSHAHDDLRTHRPLSRSQVLAPAQWDQPTEDRPRNHSVLYTNSLGNVRRKTIGPDPANVRVPVTEHDVSHIQYVNEYQPTQMNIAMYSQERTNSGYRIPEVEVDLLRLITSDRRVDRDQAQQLLALEMGNAVFLSNDWNHNLVGMHFALGIKEKITPDAWNITLSLMPAIAVVGHWSPEIPPHIWDSARYAWDTETRPWNH